MIYQHLRMARSRKCSAPSNC